MNNYKCLILLVIFCSWLSACLGPEKRDTPSLFDLGPQRSLATYSANLPYAVDATLLIPSVSASPWLDNTGIQYRLFYQDISRPDVYAQNRWVMTPAQMLTERLRARFAGAARGVVSVQDGVKADYALVVELEDFSQSFAAAQSSKATVRLRASLIDLTTRALLAQKRFSAEQPAAPNAPGAAQSLAAASDAVIEELVAWAANVVSGIKK